MKLLRPLVDYTLYDHQYNEEIRGKLHTNKLLKLLEIIIIMWMNTIQVGIWTKYHINFRLDADRKKKMGKPERNAGRTTLIPTSEQIE
jgi:hypothetical protein